MSNGELILELLDAISPKKICDDCISNELRIRPRQQVNQICNRLVVVEKQLNREKTHCDFCHKNKKTNTIKLFQRIITASDFDIKNVHRKVVEICNEIWKNSFAEKPPFSPSVMINELKANHQIPDHQANMMLTINGIRNCVEHQGLELSQREVNVASNAWFIIFDWWKLTNTSL